MKVRNTDSVNLKDTGAYKTVLPLHKKFRPPIQSAIGNVSPERIMVFTNPNVYLQNVLPPRRTTAQHSRLTSKDQKIRLDKNAKNLTQIPMGQTIYDQAIKFTKDFTPLKRDMSNSKNQYSPEKYHTQPALEEKYEKQDNTKNPEDYEKYINKMTATPNDFKKFLTEKLKDIKEAQLRQYKLVTHKLDETSKSKFRLK